MPWTTSSVIAQLSQELKVSVSLVAHASSSETTVSVAVLASGVVVVAAPDRQTGCWTGAVNLGRSDRTGFAAGESRGFYALVHDGNEKMQECSATVATRHANWHSTTSWNTVTSDGEFKG